MNYLKEFFEQNNFKRIIIEKGTIISEETSDNTKRMQLQLSVEISYLSEQENSNKGMTVKEYLEYWLYKFKANSLKPSSFDRKEGTVKNQLIPHLGNIFLKELTADDIQNMINELTNNNYSYSTIKKTHECIRECLQFAVKRNELTYNAATTIMLPKKYEKKKSDIKYFTEYEVLRIEKEAVSFSDDKTPKYRLGNAIIMLLHTGLRIGEALALKWSDVDFNKKYIKVRKNIVIVKNRDKRDNSKYQLIEQNSTKTQSGDRIVPLNKSALQAIYELKELNGTHEYILSREDGSASSPQIINKAFRRILNNILIKPVGVHTLRHTFASRLFSRGADVKTVSELLGHCRVSITYDTYIHLIQEQKFMAVDLLEELN